MTSSSVRAAGRRPAVLACLLVLVPVAAGCTEAGTKAGPDSSTRVLHLAAPEADVAPYADDLRAFAGRVAELTSGRVRVEVDFEVVPWTPDSERVIVDMLRDGETDAGLVPTRSFDTAGITGLEPLQAPLLIDSPELAGVVATSEIARRMLDSLQSRGLVGLGLVYEGLRRPLALEDSALTAAEHFRGRLMRVPPSEMSTRVVTALGAVPDPGASKVVSTRGLPYALAETELALADTDFVHPTTVTSNVVLFPKYDALLLRLDVWRSLGDDERSALQQAADETVTGSLETTRDERQLAATYCQAGGHLVEAPATELAEMRSLVAPVLDDLRADPEHAVALAELEALAEDVEAPSLGIPLACRPRTGDAAVIQTETPAPSPASAS